MVQLVCDNKKDEKALSHLIEKVRQYGGIVHDKLVISSLKGDLVINAPDPINTGEMILMVPKDILLPVRRFDFAIEDEKFVVKGQHESITKPQREVMDAMMDVFNRSKKIPFHRLYSTYWNTNKNDRLYKHLFKGRSFEAQIFPTKPKSKRTDQDLIYNFFKTRVLGFQGDMPGAEEIDESDPKKRRVTQVLMPIIDFLNHHPGTPGYITSFNGITENTGDEDVGEVMQGDGVASLKKCCIPGSDETFSTYGPYDAMDTFLSYNYVNMYAPFVRSVPLTLKIPGLGTVDIKSAPTRPLSRKLAEENQNLRMYIPRIASEPENNLVRTSHVYIPQEMAPRALRRVLGIVLAHIKRDFSDDDLMDILQDIEALIINENLNYYRKLEKILASYKPDKEMKQVAENAKMLVEIQLEKILAYPMINEMRPLEKVTAIIEPQETAFKASPEKSKKRA